MDHLPADPLLSATDLVKSYDGLRVVDGVSLTLRPGEILGIIGPNGAGKTTLFNLLAGTTETDGGRILMGGHDLSKAGAQVRIGAGIGRTFQIPRPFARMTVLENVMVSAQRQTGEGILAALLQPGRIAADERRLAAKAREILDFVSLAALENEPASVLSGGQRKLLELARVLMASPRMILLDEPAAGVNPALLETIMDRIETINRDGIAILLIEHNMGMIARLCPQVIVMAAGRQLARGTPNEVTHRADVVDVYLEGMPV